MEQLHYEPTPNPLMDAWDALPRGPAIFIATLERDRPTGGTWVHVDQAAQFFFEELDHLLAAPDDSQQHRSWVVLDQYGVGDRMLPERLSLHGLHRLLRRYGSQA